MCGSRAGGRGVFGIISPETAALLCLMPSAYVPAAAFGLARQHVAHSTAAHAVTLSSGLHAVRMKDESDFDKNWTSRIFTPENAGPWLILLVVLSLEVVNALVPPEKMPPIIADVIPVVLGKQYDRRVPPST